MERIGSYLFRKLFILIWPIITFLGLQYRKFLRSDMKSLGSLTKDSSAISDNWVISISTVIFLGTKCGDCFIDNSLDTRQVSVIDSSPVPVLSYPLTLVALSGDIALSGAIELSPEVLGGSGNTTPSKNRCFSHKRGESLTGPWCLPVGDTPVCLYLP